MFWKKWKASFHLLLFFQKLFGCTQHHLASIVVVPFFLFHGKQPKYLSTLLQQKGILYLIMNNILVKLARLVQQKVKYVHKHNIT
jgi:hypothetical protein